MTARAELASQLNGNGKPAAPTPRDLCAGLTEQLGLGELELAVVGAEVFGRGPEASVDVRLSNGTKLTFDRFAHIAKGATLGTYLATALGVSRTFKDTAARDIAAAIQRLARHHAEESADEGAREWGSEYLRATPTLEIDLGDQADRWRGFQALESIEPARDAGEDRSAWSYATKSLVLLDPSGERLVRSGWFQAYVKREVGGLYSPEQLNVQMQRVGWRRRGSEGWVKATCPSRARKLSWRFYTVESGWDE